MRKKIKEPRTNLLNGCQVSSFTVFPPNWESPQASLKKTWYISYRFYDPAFRDVPEFKYGKQVQLRGMNDQYTVEQRQQITRILRDDEVEEIIEKAFNPITGLYMKVVAAVPQSDIPPTTLFIKALELAGEKKKCEPNTKKDLRSVIKYVAMAIKRLHFDSLLISQVKLHHLMSINEQLGLLKKDKWTANNQNFYRSHLLMLFEELILWSAVEYNPAEKLPIVKVARKKKKALTLQQRIAIDKDLRKDNFNFWLFMQIFFLSGCRESELLSVKKEDVDLLEQKFTVLRKKGKSHTYLEYTIKDNAIAYWQMALVNCRPQDYVFSKRLRPGENSISPKQICRRWKRWCKDKLDKNGKPKYGLVPNFYLLKHLHTTEISNSLGTKAAADFNNESEEMIRKVYDLDGDKRKHEILKKIPISFT